MIEFSYLRVCFVGGDDERDVFGVKKSDGVLYGGLVDGDGSIEVFVGLLDVADEQHFLCFFLIILSHRSPLIHCPLLPPHKSAIKHTNHLNLVQLEQIQHLF
jgi:hypothetical protein